MRELIHDPFYNLIKNYNRCIIDYCLIEDDTPYQSMHSHKGAVLFAMRKVIERYNDEELFPREPDAELAKAHPIDASSFLFVPEIKRIDYYGKKHYDCEWKKDSAGGQIPYWYAFLEPPHGTGPVERNGKTIRKKYDREDFEIVNHALFPQGTDDLDVCEWSTDWSDYFDDGHEWWGTACWSIYDKIMNRYVVIMASATD